MSVHFERAKLLFEQSRYQMAEQELREAVAESPNDAKIHSVLGLCLSCQQRYQEATLEAETAIAIAPDSPFSHYILGYILCERQQLTAAQKVIQEAIQLNPYQASHFALLARCEYQQKRWQASLEAANQGLALDPEDVECLNYRALSLSQLGRGKEAIATAAGAIASSPQDAASYASSGWILLSHGGSQQKALEYFREALHLNPTLEWARQGVVEALKAKNPIYRLMLRYFLWCSRLNHQTRWVFTLGLLFSLRILLISFANAGLTPLAGVLAISYLLFVIFSWIADPLFTLILRCDKFGRLALSQAEIQQSNCWAACFLTAIASCILWFCTKNVTALVGAIVCGLLMIPVTATFNCEQGWTRNLMTTYTIVLIILGISSLILSITSLAFRQFENLWLLPMLLFFPGTIFACWIATILTGITPKK
ncbi:tetratricopeptide repeat protein [Nostoc sp. UHCC 0302]|uniref:tetratricopeptide repeat protein n=1 Tax=Nostoc sp. UHCC 0302 TaxID=3134896 RepID=UPI00311CAF10